MGASDTQVSRGVGGQEECYFRIGGRVSGSVSVDE